MYILDFDGTLFDTFGGIVACCAAALRRSGIEYNDEIIAHGVEDSFKHMFSDPDEYTQFLHYYAEEANSTFNDRVLPFPGTLEAITRLTELGVPLCIATSNNGETVRNILQKNSMDQFFDKIIGYESVKNTKPHPESLLKCMQGYDISPHNVVMIGDLMCDMNAAKAASADGVMINRYWNKSKNWDNRIDSLSDLLR